MLGKDPRMTLFLAIFCCLSATGVRGEGGSKPPFKIKTFIEEDVFKKAFFGFQFASSVEGNNRTRSYTPKLSFSILSTDYSDTEMDLNINLYYRYRNVELMSEEQSSDTWGLDYAKIVLNRLMGWDLSKKIKPYASLGAERTNLRTKTASGTEAIGFWAATWGLGLEVPLMGERITLEGGYKQNFRAGKQRFSEVSAGLNYRFFEMK